MTKRACDLFRCDISLAKLGLPNFKTFTDRLNSNQFGKSNRFASCFAANHTFVWAPRQAVR